LINCVSSFLKKKMKYNISLESIHDVFIQGKKDLLSYSKTIYEAGELVSMKSFDVSNFDKIL